MHEMSVTLSMMGIVRDHMAREGARRLRRLRVRVGELTAVEPGALSFCFEVCTKGTSLEGASLDIEEVPYRGRCNSCSEQFHMEGFLQLCPRCEGTDIVEVSGNELDIISMEVL